MRLWDELSLPWQACMELAWEAYCDDCFPIGAVVTSADGTILSRGRNRIYENQKAGRHTRGAELDHAEVEALRKLDFDTIDPHSCTLFSTTEPCPMCMGTFYMSGIRTLYYASRDPYAGSKNLLGTTWYLSRKPIKVFPPENRLLELIIMAMFVEQDLQNHKGELPPNTEILYQRWMDVVPECVPFGRLLYDNGVLSKARSHAYGTPNMLDLVVEKSQA
jgi:tRNA(Arg) A34 adenosine deaminase TadA